MCTTGTSFKHADAVDKPVKKIRRRRLSPEERAARRRKQHRELVARGRAKARSSLAQAREEESSLRRKLLKLVESYSFVARMGSSLECDQILWKGSLRAKIVDAIVEQTRLEKANEQLQDQLDEYLAFEKLVVGEGESTYDFLADGYLSDYDGTCLETNAVTRRLRTELGEPYWDVASSDAEDVSIASLTLFSEDGESCIV